MTTLRDHRGGDCGRCNGTGYKWPCDYHDFDADTEPEPGSCPECTECDDCDGTGLSTWTWDDDRHGVCDKCGARGVRVADWLKDGGWDTEEEVAVCERCALASHAAACGCAEWPRVTARDGAARVLRVVAQLAALMQGQRLAWVAKAGERVRDVMDEVRVQSDGQAERDRRTIAKLRWRNRQRPPKGYSDGVDMLADRQRKLSTLEALRDSGTLAPDAEQRRLEEVAWVMRERAKWRGYGWPEWATIAGPKGRLP